MTEHISQTRYRDQMVFPLASRAYLVLLLLNADRTSNYRARAQHLGQGPRLFGVNVEVQDHAATSNMWDFLADCRFNCVRRRTPSNRYGVNPHSPEHGMLSARWRRLMISSAYASAHSPEPDGC